MSEIRFPGCFAQNAEYAVKPGKDFTRLWVDAWPSPVDLAKLLELHRHGVRFEVVVTPVYDD